MMSTYFDIRTKATIEDVLLSNQLQIVHNNQDCYIRDNYNNTLTCHYDDEGRIVRVTRYGAHDITFILYYLVVYHECLILDEYSDLELIHQAFLQAEPTATDIKVQYGTSYEEFTISMLNYLNDDEHCDRYDLKRVEERLRNIEEIILNTDNNQSENSLEKLDHDE